MRSIEWERPDQIRLSNILSHAFELIGLEWRRLAVIALLFAWAPAEIVSFLQTHSAANAEVAAFGGAMTVNTLAQLARFVSIGYGSAVAIATLLHRVDGERSPTRANLKEGLPALPIAVAILILANAPGFYALLNGMPKTYGSYWLFTLLNNISVLIWGVVFGSTLALVLDQRLGAFPAVVGAMRLSRGHRWQLTVIGLTIQGAFVAGQEFVSFLSTIFLGYRDTHVQSAWLFLTCIAGYAINVSIYRELSTIKNGLTTSELSYIFD
jgi:hypothetical protein